MSIPDKSSRIESPSCGLPLRSLGLAVLLAAASAPVAKAAILWKDSSLDSLNLATSWWTTEAGTADGTAPTSADVLRFGGSGQAASQTYDLGGSFTVAGVRLDNKTLTPNYNVTINGSAGQVLTINAGDATGGATGDGMANIAYGILLNSGTGGNLTINADVALGANQSWVTGNNRTLTLGGGVNLGVRTLAFNVAGGTQTVAGVISGTGSITKAGAGVLNLNNAANTFTGSLSAAGAFVGGTVNVVSLKNVGSADSLGNQVAGSRTIALNGTTFVYTGSDNSVTDRTIDLRAGSVISNTGAGTVNFTATSILTTLTASARTLTLAGSNTGDNIFAAVISNSGTGANITRLQKSGTGTWVLTGASTATGAAIINQGTLRLTGSAVLTGAAGSTSDENNIWFSSGNAGAVLQFETAAQLGAASQIRFRNSPGPAAGAGGRLEFVGTTDQIVSKDIQCDSTIGVRLSSESSTAKVTFNGSFATIVGGTRPVYLEGSSTTLNEITSAIGTGINGLTKRGTGTWVLSGNSNYTAATSVTAGTLILGNANALGTTAAGTTVSSGAVLDLKGQTVGAEALNLSGTGINSGGVLINSSAAAASISGAVTLAANSTVSATGDLALSGAIGGAFSLTKQGAGTLALTSASSTFSGGTFISEGALSLGTMAALGAGNLSLGSGSNNTQLVYTGSAETSAKAITMAGTTGGVTLTQSGTGNLNLTSGIVVSSGGAKQLTLQGSTAGTGELSGILADGSGSAVNILKTGSGTWTLSGANTYTGTTEIAGGTLALGAAGVINDANAVNITGGTFSLGDNNETVNTVSLSSGSITGGTGVLTATSGITANIGDGVTATLGAITGGSSALTKQGLGTLSVTKALGHSGGTTVSAGTLSAGGASVLTGDITVAGGTLALGSNNQSAGAISLSSGNITGTAELTATSFAASNSSAASISAVLAGSGVTFSKSGAGVLTLSAANTYTGLTSVNAGTLSVTGSIGAAEVADGAILRGTGTVGNVTLANGSTLEGGVSGSGTLTVGDVTVASSAVANLNVNNIGAYTSSEALALGNVTLLSGSSIVVNVTGPFVSSLTPYLLFTYDNGSNPFIVEGAGTNLSITTVGMSSRLTATPNIDTLGSVYLTIGGSKVIWGSGSSTWQNEGPSEVNTVPVWTAGGSATAFIAADDVVFGDGGSASVDIATDVNPGSIEFSATNTDYVFTSSNNSKITGVGSVTKSGASKVTLSTANTYSGGTTVSDGRILVGNNAALGTGTITLNGGALSSDSATARTITNNLAIGGSVTLGDATENGALTFQTGTVDLGASTRQITVASDVTLAGTVSSGGITKAGSGTLTLSGTNDFAGGVSVTAGRVRAGSGSAFGSGTVTLASGTAVSSDSGTARVLGNAFTLTGNATVGNGTDSGALTLSGAVDLAGNTLTVASGTTFSGSVTAGALSVSNGTLGLGAANVLADTTSVALGSGTVFSLGGFSDTVGDVTVDAATVSNGTLTAGSLSVTSSGTISANLAGAGALTKTGNGTLTLSGANSSFSGAVTVNGGSLALGSASALGTGALNLGSGVSLASDGGTARTLTNNLTLNGNVTLGDGTNNGVLNFSTGTVDLADGNRTITTASNVTLGGVISSANAASGALTKAGAGTLTLSGANTYTGGTTVSNGTLVLGNAGVLADTGAVSLASGTTFNLGGFAETVGDVTVDAATISNGTLTANSIAATSSGTISAIIAGSGTLTKSGNGTLTLTGANTISGNVSITGGTLSTGTALGTSAISIGANGTLALSRGSIGNTMANTLSGSGAIVYTSTAATPANGELGLTGTSTFSGTITVNSGKLAFENAGSLGGAPILNVASGAFVSIGSGFSGGTAYITNLTGGGTVNTAWQGAIADIRTLSVNSTASSTFSGVLADAASPARVLAFTKTGAETLILTGSNTYTGATTVSAGTLQIGNGGATGDIGSVSTSAITTIASGATLRFFRSGTPDYSGTARLRTLTGAGDLIVEGTGANGSLIITVNPASGSNTTAYSGAVDGWGGFSGNFYIKGGAEYRTSRNGATALGTSTITLGDVSSSGTFAQHSGNWSFTNNIVLVGADNYIANRSTGAPRTMRLFGVISGSGKVTFDDPTSAMTFTDRSFMLLADNTMSGEVVINAHVRVGAVLTQDSTTLNNSYYAGSTGSLGTANVTINSGKVLSFTRTNEHTVANTITGAGQVRIGSDSGTVTGSGTITVNHATLGNTYGQVVNLTGNNSYSGGTELMRGTLNVSSLANIGSGHLAVKGGTVAEQTGTFNYTGVSATTNRNLWIDNGRATINVTEAETTLAFTGTAGTLGGVSGNLITKGGAGTLELADAITAGTSTAVSVTGGTLRLYGVNDYAGATTIDTGATLEIAGAGTLASSPIAISGNLNFNSTATTALGGALTGNGTLTKSNTGVLSISIANANFAGSAVVSGGTLVLGDAAALGSGTVTLSGGTLDLGGLAATNAITYNSGTLSGASAYAGSLTIAGGTLTFADLTTFGTGSITVGTGATLDINFLNPTNAITLNGGTLLNFSSWNGGVTLAGTVDSTLINSLAANEVTVTTGSTVDLTGVTKDIVFAGGTLNNLASYTGTLTVQTALDLSGSTPSADATIKVGNGGSVDFGNNAFAGAVQYSGGSISNFSGDVTVIGTGVSLAAGNLGTGNLVVGTGASVTIGAGFTNAIRMDGGAITGETLNNFSGTLTVAAGKTLDIDGDDNLTTIASGATLVVEDGATLKGSGSVGQVTIQSGGILAPGNSPGLLTFTGLTLSIDPIEGTAGSMTMEIASLFAGDGGEPVAGVDFDSVEVSGLLDLSQLSSSSRFMLNLLTLAQDLVNPGAPNGWDPATDFSLTLFTYGNLDLGGNADINTLFSINSAGFLDADGLQVNANHFRVINDELTQQVRLSYSAVPEPSTYGAILGGLALVAAAVRRRRKQASK